MTRSSAMGGTAMMEFALAWPIALLVVMGSVQLAVWGVESYGARSAALAGARAGSVSGGSSELAAAVTLRALAPSLVGVHASVWCPGQPGPRPPVWVCATEAGAAIEVDVGGSVPALLPMVGANGLPVRARVVLQKEVFAS